jgi:hypothetical protein
VSTKYRCHPFCHLEMSRPGSWVEHREAGCEGEHARPRAEQHREPRPGSMEWFAEHNGRIKLNRVNAPRGSFARHIVEFPRLFSVKYVKFLL